MIKRLYPNLYEDSIFTLDYDMLYTKGIRHIVFDIDNTLAPYDEASPPERVVSHLKQLESNGFKVCLLSNNSKKRVDTFNVTMGYPSVYRARKPLLAGVKRAMRLIGGKPSDTALIGDQVFTDIWCGNRLGLYTVLVKPLTERDEITVRLKRRLERGVVKAYLKYSKANNRHSR